MKKSLTKITILIYAVCLILAALVTEAQADPRPAELISKINSYWRSSDRYIEEDTLREQALKKIPRALLARLGNMELRQLKGTLETESRDPKSTLQVNQGMAENILKIRQIVRRTLKLKSSSPSLGEVVSGLTQNQVEDFVKGLPPVSRENRKPKEFSATQQEIRDYFNVAVSENDFYALKIAAHWWTEGKIDNVETVSEVFARGRDEVPYLNITGQNYALQMLEQLRFTEADIQHLKSHPTMNHIPEGFWQYLRTWKFKGSAQIIPVGTLVGHNTPFMQIRGNPIDIAIAEALTLALMDEFTRASTYATRAVVASPGTPIVEGGTRRGFGGMIRALASYIAGFVATANARAARLFDIPLSGSAENHSLVGQYDDEMDAHTSVLKNFERPLSFLLTDTYELERGVKAAIRASQRDLKGIRVDSLIPGMGVEETLSTVTKWVRDSGSNVPVLFSDDLDEKVLQRLREAKAPFSFALIGGRMRNGPSLGLVMKTTYVKDLVTGEEHGVAKMANPEKAGWPFKKQVYRIFDKHKKFLYDLITRAEEPQPENSEAMLIDGMIDGKYLDVPVNNEEVKVSRQRTADQVKYMPQEIFDVNAKAHIFEVQYSDILRRDRDQVIQRYRPNERPLRVGVFPYSGEPTHESHVDLVKFMKNRYQLDVVYVVLTGDHPVSSTNWNKKYRLEAGARLDIAKNEFKGIPWIRYYKGEINSPTPVRTYQTLEAIEKLAPPGSDLFVLGGSDLMKKQLAHFKNAKEILNKYNWIIANRTEEKVDKETETVQTPQELAAKLGTDHRTLDKDGWVLKTSQGKIFEMGDYPLLKMVSSSTIRNFYDQAGNSFIIHGVESVNLKLLDPYRILPHFYSSSCGAACSPEAISKDRAEGYRAYFIVDENSSLTASEVTSLGQAGVKFMTQREYQGLMKTWKDANADWASVINDLHHWEFQISTGADCTLAMDALGKNDLLRHRP